MNGTVARRSAAGPGHALLEATFRVSPRSGGRQTLPDGAHQVGALRRRAQTSLHGCGLGHLADDVALVVSELTTNAIVHSGGSEITLLLDIHDDVLHIAVRDGMPGYPAVRTPGDEEECGRGLQLVRWVAGERDGAWGTSDGGATTWCDLPVAEVGR